MKPRETRRNTIIAARIRDGQAWCDAHILNLSSRGLLLHSAPAPSRGAYVEVRRGAYVIVAQVVWATDDRFGLRTQDLLAVDSLIANDSPDSPAAADGGKPATERRKQQRSEQLERRHALSRETGRSLEFAAVAGFGAGLAVLVYLAAAEVLARPLSEVAFYLGTPR